MQASHILSVASLAMLVAAGAGRGESTLIAVFDGTLKYATTQAVYQTAPTNMNDLDRDGDGGFNDNGFGVPFRSRLDPTLASYGTTGGGTAAGPAFFGGYEYIRYNAAKPGEEAIHRVQTNASGDYLRSRGRYNVVGDRGEVAGVLLFETAESVLFSGSAFRMTLHSADNFNLKGRFVLRSGYQYYISAHEFEYVANGAPELVLAASTPFHPYAPAVALRFDDTAPGVPVYPPFSEVTEVGFYFGLYNFHRSSTAIRADYEIGVRKFSVEASLPTSSLVLVR